jgi:hypothetical protein
LIIKIPIEKLQLLVGSVKTALEGISMATFLSETEEMPPSKTDPHDTTEISASETTPAMEIVTVVDNPNHPRLGNWDSC